MICASITGLFLFLIDRTTKETEEGEGVVLGGAPISCEDIAQVLGTNRRAVMRWKDQLEEAGYIRTALTNGHGKPRWWVLKTKKFVVTKMDNEPKTVVTKMDNEPQTVVTKMDKRCHENGQGLSRNVTPNRDNREYTEESKEEGRPPTSGNSGKAGEPAKQDNSYGVVTKMDNEPQSVVPKTSNGLFVDHLRDIVEKHGQDLVDKVIAHSAKDAFWTHHTPSSIAKTFKARLDNYQRSLKQKPKSKNKWLNTGDASWVQVKTI